MDLETAKALPKGTLVFHPASPEWAGKWRGVAEDNPTWCWVEYLVFGDEKLMRDRLGEVEVL